MYRHIQWQKQRLFTFELPTNSSRQEIRLLVELAERAIALHSALGHPGDEALSTLLNSPSLINCGVTASDLRNARELQGSCPICLQAKPLPPVTGSYPTYREAARGAHKSEHYIRF